MAKQVQEQEQSIKSLEAQSSVRLYTGLMQGAIVGLIIGGTAAWVISRRIKFVEVDENGTKNKSKKKKIVLNLTRSDVLKVAAAAVGSILAAPLLTTGPLSPFGQLKQQQLEGEPETGRTRGQTGENHWGMAISLDCALDVNTVCAPAVPRMMWPRLLHGMWCFQR